MRADGLESVMIIIRILKLFTIKKGTAGCRDGRYDPASELWMYNFRAIKSAIKHNIKCAPSITNCSSSCKGSF